MSLEAAALRASGDGRRVARAQRYCPGCREYVLVSHEGRCLWCDGNTREEGPSRDQVDALTAGMKRRRRPGRPKGKYRRMTERQIRAAHTLYVREGLSFNQLGRLLYECFGYASAKACGVALCKFFKEFGLPTRDRIEATVKASTRHGRKRRNLSPEEEREYRRWLRDQRGWRAIQWEGRPQCRGVKKHPPRKGERCQRPATKGSDYCFAHDPEKELRRQAHLASVRRGQPKRPMVPLEPFAAWVDRLYAELGTLRCVAEALDCSVTTALNITKREGTLGGRRQRVTTIGRDVVERRLAAASGPSIEELYGEDLEEAIAA